MPQVMKCHYEVLEVERNADDTTLKKQYRKLALKVAIHKYGIMSVKIFIFQYHPDKNPDDPEGAKATFQVSNNTSLIFEAIFFLIFR